jgi:hypothetical protein
MNLLQSGICPQTNFGSTFIQVTFKSVCVFVGTEKKPKDVELNMCGGSNSVDWQIIQVTWSFP